MTVYFALKAIVAIVFVVAFLAFALLFLDDY